MNKQKAVMGEILHTSLFKLADRFNDVERILLEREVSPSKRNEISEIGRRIERLIDFAIFRHSNGDLEDQTMELIEKINNVTVDINRLKHLIYQK